MKFLESDNQPKVTTIINFYTVPRDLLLIQMYSVIGLFSFGHSTVFSILNKVLNAPAENKTQKSYLLKNSIFCQILYEVDSSLNGEVLTFWKKNNNQTSEYVSASWSKVVEESVCPCIFGDCAVWGQGVFWLISLLGMLPVFRIMRN